MTTPRLLPKGWTRPSGAMAKDAMMARAIQRRGSSASGGGGGSAGRAAPVIVKVVSGPRSRDNVIAVARYVARLGAQEWEGERRREDAEPLLFDEFGSDIPRAEVIEKVRKEWGLLEDWQHLSKEAEAWRDEHLDWKMLTQKARLKRVQARHLVVSVPTKNKTEDDQLTAAARAFVHEAFGWEGYQCVCAVHREHGESHVHVLVNTRCEDGGRLRFDKAGLYLDTLRETLAEHARAVGLDVEASRQTDRPELVDEVLAGEVSLAPPFDRADIRDGLEAVPARMRGMTRLAGRVPIWFNERAEEYAERLAPVAAPVKENGPGLFERLLGRKAAEPPPPPAIPDGPLRGLAERLRALGVFRDASGRDETMAALASYTEMAGEDKRLADWYLTHQPRAFGPVAAEAPQALAEDRDLARLMRALPPPKRRPPATAEARKDAQRRLETIHAARSWERDRIKIATNLVLLADAWERVDPDGVVGAAALRDRVDRLLHATPKQRQEAVERRIMVEAVERREALQKRRVRDRGRSR
ncbi:MAG: relaxase/mobilization nuclease domain-containing protein [Alphaproteobacteria bacterium]|nr:relaxase/mobilization nuclease domain-containing protein [Alphaproteobacteria bacterium]